MTQLAGMRDPSWVTDAEQIAELKRENAELRRLVEELRKELEEWKRGHRERRRRRSSQSESGNRATGNGPGRPSGAKGSNRPVPEKIHATVEHPVPAACDCGGPKV